MPEDLTPREIEQRCAMLKAILLEGTADQVLEDILSGYGCALGGATNDDDPHDSVQSAWDVGFWVGHYQRLIDAGEASPNG